MSLIKTIVDAVGFRYVQKGDEVIKYLSIKGQLISDRFIESMLAHDLQSNEKFEFSAYKTLNIARFDKIKNHCK